MKAISNALVAALIVGVLPAPGRAQVEVGPGQAPREVIDAALEACNAPGTLRFLGPSTIPAGSRLEGDVCVAGADLQLQGSVEGSVIVLNGDLRLERGALIQGRVVVLGGRVRRADLGSVGGDTRVYVQPVRFRVEDGQVVMATEAPGEGLSAGLRFGDLRLLVRAGENYNRVEGLPILVGPVVETSSSNPLRFEASVLYRTRSGLDPGLEELGYRLRVEQRIGGRDNFAIGGSVGRSTRAIESWGITDLEASLATFLMHEDYRDYYNREGWSLYALIEPRTVPLRSRIGYVEEDHWFAPVAGPWSLTDNDEPWRGQPLVAEGRVKMVEGSVTYDSRNRRDAPSNGWLVRGEARKGWGDDLSVPSYRSPYAIPLPPETPELGPTPVSGAFAHGHVDLRSYNRVGPNSTLTLRGVFSGSLDGDPVPPQYQTALGGEGSLPGYSLFQIDCGARDIEVGFPGQPLEPLGPGVTYPAYGCDRSALFQAEYRSRYLFDIGPDEQSYGGGWFSDVRLDLSWSLFLNVGKGWTVGEAPAVVTPRRDQDAVADVGVGVSVGRLGLFWAYPLSGDDRAVNFFVRLSRRF